MIIILVIMVFCHNWTVWVDFVEVVVTCVMYLYPQCTSYSPQVGLLSIFTVMIGALEFGQKQTVVKTFLQYELHQRLHPALCA